MGDEEQLAGLQPEVLTPPLSTGDSLAVQRGQGRVERFEHGQRGHIDAANRQTHGVAAQVVGQRFDFG